MNPTKCLNISGTVHNFSLLSWLNRVRFNIMNYEYCVRESTIAAYNVIVQQPYFISLQRKNAVEERKNGRERGRIKERARNLLSTRGHARFSKRGSVEKDLSRRRGTRFLYRFPTRNIVRYHVRAPANFPLFLGQILLHFNRL